MLKNISLSMFNKKYIIRVHDDDWLQLYAHINSYERFLQIERALYQQLLEIIISQMFEIVEARLSHAEDIANCQCNMAIETQKVELKKQLVLDAVKYLIQHHQYGNYLVSINRQQPDKAYSSLLITYQNPSSWWIQSVYVMQYHRRKGIFNTMFKTAIQKGKQKGAKTIQIYVWKQNIALKKTYQKFGFHCNGNQFYGYDLTYGDSDVIKILGSKLSEDISVLRGEENHPKQEQNKLIPVSGQRSGNKDKILFCYDKKEIIGQCQYFYEFSDWRFGFIVYLNFFISSPELKKAQLALESFLKFLYQNSPLKIGAIRMIIKQKQFERVEQIIPNMHRDIYDVMQIDL